MNIINLSLEQKRGYYKIFPFVIFIMSTFVLFLFNKIIGSNNFIFFGKYYTLLIDNFEK